MDDGTLSLPDGRTLAWATWGPPDGRPLLVLHATPGSRRQFEPAPDESPAPGVRFIALDRPGYGRSTFNPRGTLSTAAHDVGALADHLALTSFDLLAVSGGAATALGSACRLGARVQSTVLLSPALPPRPDVEAPKDDADGASDEPTPDAADASEADDLDEPVAPSPRARLRCELQIRRSRWFIGSATRSLQRQLGAADASLLDRPEVRDRFVSDRLAPSPTTARAILQDVGLCADVWLLPLEDIVGPVAIWHGTDDQTVPVERARELRDEIPHATLREFEGEGHLLAVSHFTEAAASLA